VIFSEFDSDIHAFVLFEHKQSKTFCRCILFLLVDWVS